MSIRTMVVLGSNSFSGGHCVDYFLEHSDAKIIGISRSPEYPAFLLPYKYQKKPSKRFSFYQLDINVHLKEILRLLDRKKPDVIINFAAQGNAQYSWNNPADWLTTNALGIINLTDALRKREYLKRYIHVTTPEVYGSVKNFKENSSYYNPGNPYAVSKAAADMFVQLLQRQHGFPVILTRSSNIYGPHQQLYRIIPRAIIYSKQGKKIPLHSGGTAMRSFIHIGDIMSGIALALEKGKLGHTYHFSTETGSIKSLVKIICKKMQKDFKTSVEINGERSKQDAVYELNTDKAHRELGWTPKISLDQGIEQTIQWINESWDEIQRSPLEYVHTK